MFFILILVLYLPIDIYGYIILFTAYSISVNKISQDDGSNHRKEQ